MSSPDELRIVPADQWFTEQDDRIQLHHPFDGTPLRGYDFARDATEPPTQFHYNIDWHDGYMEWRRAKEQTGDTLNISVLLTDPARSDGFGNEDFLRYALGEFDMIGYSATRSVYHTALHRGAQPYLFGSPPWGSILGDPRQANIEYRERLQELLLEAGKPAFSFDPSFGPHEPAQNLVAGVQALRAIAYVEAYKQKNMRDPDLAFFVPDFVHTNSLQCLQMGIAGLKMREMVDERNFGELPESLLLIVPADQSAIIDKIEVASGISINADVALGALATPAYLDDQYMHAYATVPRQGYIPL